MTFDLQIDQHEVAATLWISHNVAQLRLDAEGSRQLSLWLGSCAAKCKDMGLADDVVAGITSLTFSGLNEGSKNGIVTNLQRFSLDCVPEPQIHCIRVGYWPDYGDTPWVCDALGVDFETLVALHSKNDYYVACIGFLPGFVYLGGGNTELQLPRKNIPSPRVDKGAVAIADSYTGIYPMVCPGGWHVIGHTKETVSQIDTQWKVGDLIRIEVIDS